MASEKPRQVIFSRPADPSLEGFRRWIEETTIALGGKLDEISEEEWVRGWKKFWGAAD